MWIRQIVICLTALNLRQFVFSSPTPTFCVYKNDNLRLNRTSSLTAGEDDWHRMLESEHQQARGVFLDDGFERCEDSLNTSYCYTLWVKPNVTAEPYVAKQGCWIHPSALVLGECQASRCGGPLLNSTTASSRLHFCCCTGNKCNRVQDSKQANKKPPETHQPSEPIDPVQEDDVNKESANSWSKYCAFKWSAHTHGKPAKMAPQDDQNLGGTIQADGVTVKCDDNNDSCFSYYTLDAENSTRVTVKMQGCWKDEGSSDMCASSRCIPHEKNKRRNNYHFCCCRGNMCNNNISKDYIPVPTKVLSTMSNDPVQHRLQDPSYKERTIVISLLSVFSLAVIILSLYLVYRFCCRPPTPPARASQDVENPESPMFDIDNLKISCLINKGRFSEVWKGSLNEQDVAVKIYAPPYRQYYYNEKYIYSLPHMEHDNIMKFFGGEERILQDGNVQYLLVLQYVPEGTLMNYLKNNTLDWYTMCKMCLTLARGLAHLHAHIGPPDDFKATVVHRDVNSRNVLVKPDLSLVIADLGFCLTTMGSKLIHKNHTENAEQTSLTDVGTLRYMAPELLDGAVNLRDCEASLKQIDMYAVGLVMWEISSRCSDLYQGCPLPEFMLPYQAEAGSHPTFEEMQVLVSRNKVRPKFPEVWKDYNQAIHALKETMEECWDHDAEARLTALCVEERVMEMKMLWTHDNRNKVNKGVTPTINTALLCQVPGSNRSGYQGNGLTQWGGLSSSSDPGIAHVVAEGNTSALIINDIRNSSTGDQEIATAVKSDSRGSFSTSTVDTVLPTTPSEGVQTHPKSQNINAQINQHVPPNQGRNPIVERNTHKRSDEELAVVGNSLYYGKDSSEREFSNSNSMFDSLTDSLESSLMQNDTLNHACSHNRRFNTSRTNDRPRKVVNNPNNRLDNLTTADAIASAQLNTVPKVRKSKEMGFLGHLALLSKLAFSSKFDGKKNTDDNQNSVGPRTEVDVKRDSTGRRNPMYEPSQLVETEVLLKNTGPVVQPAKKLINTSVGGTEMVLLRGNSLESDSVDSSEADLQSDSPLISHHRVAPYSKSTSDLSPKKSSPFSKLEDESKKPRPSTLSLKGHNYRQSHSGSLSSLSKLKSVLSQKTGKPESKHPLLNGCIHQRDVKMADVIDKRKNTGGKNGRHSLNDDRLMSDADRASSEKPCKSSRSMQHLTSITESQASKQQDCTC